MELETVGHEKGDRIATVTVSRPEKGNALSHDLRDALDLLMAGRPGPREKPLMTHRSSWGPMRPPAARPTPDPG